MFKTRSSSVLPTPREQESFLSKIWKNKAELFDAKQRVENYFPLAHRSPKTLNYISMIAFPVDKVLNCIIICNCDFVFQSREGELTLGVRT